MALDIERDIRFDDFGDISFLGNDIETLLDYSEILYQNIIDRIVSNNGDYKLNPNFGADIQSLIGMTNENEIESTFDSNVLKALTSDGFLSPSEIVIVSFVEEGQLFARIAVLSTLISTPVEIVNANITMNLQTGASYAIK